MYDSLGNNNNRLDPGERANLTVVFRNIGGVNFNNLSAQLFTSDPYITIIDGSANYGSLAIDSTRENLFDPFTVQVSPSSPCGRAVLFKIIASDSGYLDTFEFSLTVGPYHYLVWNPDPTPSSGQIIHNTLRNLGYTGTITTELLTEPLDLYQSLFITLGIYPNNYRIPANSQEALAIVNYLNNGGRVYLEGGDAWYYDPQVGGHNFNSLFGLTGISDGSGDLGPVLGFANTFTQSMYFNYSGENNYIDRINATNGFLIFRDGDNSYNCGVAYSPGNYRTVGLSFELGGLVDAQPPSTKAVLLDSIMRFFGITLTALTETPEPGFLQTLELLCSPNPFSTFTKIKLPDSNILSLKIYDIQGTLVKEISPSPGNDIVWTGKDHKGKKLPSGVYFIIPTGPTEYKPVRVLLIKY
ncbi:MAG: T9SS type A sorting domain-containing protein [candidate division WOR-3 bacterium]